MRYVRMHVQQVGTTAMTGKAEYSLEEKAVAQEVERVVHQSKGLLIDSSATPVCTLSPRWLLKHK